MKKSLFLTFAAMLGLAALQPARADDTLFQDLGGREGLARIVDTMLEIALQDPRIKEKFSETNMVRLERELAVHLCDITGGPCEYQGRTMAEAHVELQLTHAHFNALVEILQVAMDREKIPFRTQNKLMAILAPMHRDVVTE